MVYGIKAVADNEGILIVTVVSNKDKKEINGTVCKDGFDWHSANLFCQSIGYIFGDWGSYPRNLEYAPKYIFN